MKHHLDIFNDQSSANRSVENEIIHSAEIIKSNVCDYNDAYILVRGDIAIIECNAATQVPIKSCA